MLHLPRRLSKKRPRPHFTLVCGRVVIVPGFGRADDSGALAGCHWGGGSITIVLLRLLTPKYPPSFGTVHSPQVNNIVKWDLAHSLGREPSQSENPATNSSASFRNPTSLFPREASRDHRNLAVTSAAAPKWWQALGTSRLQTSFSRESQSLY